MLLWPQMKLPSLFYGIFSGFLIGTSYMPFPPWAVFFGYVPLLIILCRDKIDLKQAWWISWTAQFTLTLIGFNWVAYLVRSFAFIGVSDTYNYLLWSLSILALILFCSLIHLYIPIALTIGVFLKNKLNLTQPTFLGLQVLLLSLAERAWPSLFPWHLGYTLLGSNFDIAQLADLVGFSGLSTIVLLFNAVLALAYLSKSWTRRIGLSFFLLCVFVALTFFGKHQKNKWEDTDSVINVTLVQGNIGNSEKVYAEKGLGYQDYILDKYIDLTQKSLIDFPKTDLIIWPETAFPDYLDKNHLSGPHQKKLTHFIKSTNTYFLIGSYSKSFVKNIKESPSSAPNSNTLFDSKIYTNFYSEQKIFNSLFILNPEGSITEPHYNKTHLVAFSEYFPFSDIFPFLLKLPFVSNFGRGEGPMVQQLNMGSNKYFLGPQICYEGLYDHFSRDQSLKGAQILVNLTNDSWFGWWAEPYQHMYMTLARAIETRRPLIRATNTGISTAVLATGEQLESSPISSEWYGHYSIRFKNNAPQTFYVMYGYLNWILILLAALGLIMRGYFKR